ncbi:vomeronasal type-2 receptor 26-like [Tachyglossus aculeatus]|uniref:vomeronasal type-2 receptor 26-like n=1 Tax=Tachyglossus aculeatus TaxID=9261 RepID=UPI0018F3AFF4|nr:vomeronasal type-2 receptor 26-like [Tachyglossus aculeatus]
MVNSLCTLKRNYASSYYQDGDVVIGGFLSLDVISTNIGIFKNITDRPLLPRDSVEYITKHYQHLLALEFAVEEINNDPSLLTNISLGFHIFNVHFQGMITAESSMALLSGKAEMVPNYNCEPERRDKLLAVIGGMNSEVTTPGSWLLGLHKLPQISYGPEDPTLRDKAYFPSLCQISESSSALPSGMSCLMKHFQWVGIGLLVSNDIRGETFTAILTEEMAKNVICVAYVYKITTGSVSTDVPLHLSLKKVQVYIGTGEQVHLDDPGWATSRCDILNYQILQNGTKLCVKVGESTPLATAGPDFTIREEKIM